MGRGEFEEIFEECLSALLEGRRSIEESLFLYPAWRGHLEPLLRAAEEAAAGFQVTPPPQARERGLHRFLEAARARRRLRQMLPPRAARSWRWAAGSLTAVAAIGVLAFASATLMAEGGQELSSRSAVRVIPYTTPMNEAAPAAAAQTPLERVEERVSILESSVREGEPVQALFLEELEEANNELASGLDSPKEMGLIDRLAAVSAANREYAALQRLQGQWPGAPAGAVEASLAAAGDVLRKLGATPTPLATPTPSPTPAPSPTSSPEPTATAEPTETATPPPSTSHQ